MFSSCRRPWEQGWSSHALHQLSYQRYQRPSLSKKVSLGATLLICTRHTFDNFAGAEMESELPKREPYQE